MRAVAAFFVAAFTYEMAPFFVSSPACAGKVGDTEQVIIVGSGRRAAKAWRELRIRYRRTETPRGLRL